MKMLRPASGYNFQRGHECPSASRHPPAHWRLECHPLPSSLIPYPIIPQGTSHIPLGEGFTPPPTPSPGTPEPRPADFLASPDPFAPPKKRKIVNHPPPPPDAGLGAAYTPSYSWTNHSYIHGK